MALWCQIFFSGSELRVEGNQMDVVAVKAYLPKSLKRQAFVACALRGMTYSRWTREQLEGWLKAQKPVENGMGLNSSSPGSIEADAD